MDWKSKRIGAPPVEAALIENKAAHDVTTAVTVDRKLRATASIVAEDLSMRIAADAS